LLLDVEEVDGYGDLGIMAFKLLMVNYYKCACVGLQLPGAGTVTVPAALGQIAAVRTRKSKVAGGRIMVYSFRLF
jgi:hypothetical protein